MMLKLNNRKKAKKQKRPAKNAGLFFWPEPESNWRHKDFQSSALPTELPGQ